MIKEVPLAILALLCSVTSARAHPASDSGEQIYRNICQGCHMPAGEGAKGAGSYPALAHNARLASWQYVAITVLNGRNAMPSFGRAGSSLAPQLSDADVADVINYLRTHFGNRYPRRVSSAQVASLPHPRNGVPP